MTVWDAGLQPERTLLAWRRTCLSFAIASAVAVRFTAEAGGAFAVVAGIVGVGLSLVAFAAASRRYRAEVRTLTTTGALGAGALPLVAAVAAAVVLGLAGGVYLVLGFLAEVAA